MTSLLDPSAPLTNADIVTMLADFGRACLENAAKPSPDTERKQLEAGARIIKAIMRANPDLSPGGSSPSDTIDSLKAELETANEARRQAQREAIDAKRARDRSRLEIMRDVAAKGDLVLVGRARRKKRSGGPAKLEFCAGDDSALWEGTSGEWVELFASVVPRQRPDTAAAVSKATPTTWPFPRLELPSPQSDS